MGTIPMGTDEVCARIEHDMLVADSGRLAFTWGCAVHPADWDGQRVLGLTTQSGERLLLSVDALKCFDSVAAFARGRVATVLASGPRTRSRIDWWLSEEPDPTILCEDLTLSLMITPTLSRREHQLWLTSDVTPAELLDEPLVLLCTRRPSGLPR